MPVQVDALLGGGGGGGKGYVGPPSQIIGGAWPPLAPPLPTHMLTGCTLVNPKDDIDPEHLTRSNAKQMIRSKPVKVCLRL